MVFLAYYSYVILFAFRPTITVAEWIVIVWIGTLLVEEIREVDISNISIQKTMKCFSKRL